MDILERKQLTFYAKGGRELYQKKKPHYTLKIEIKLYNEDSIQPNRQRYEAINCVGSFHYTLLNIIDEYLRF